MRRKGSPERFSPFWDRSRLRRSVHRTCETIVMRRNSFTVECAKVSGLSNNLHLTKRALDAGESARFSGILHASAFFSFGRRAAARPSASNANRWVRAKKEKQLFKVVIKVRLEERAARVS